MFFLDGLIIARDLISLYKDIMIDMDPISQNTKDHINIYAAYYKHRALLKYLMIKVEVLKGNKSNLKFRRMLIQLEVLFI